MRGARQRRQNVRIEEPVTEGGDFGEGGEKWKEFLTENAKVEPLSGRQLEQARQLQEHVDTKATLRWSEKAEQITNAMRIRFRNRILNVQASINVEERDRYVEVFCVEVK